ncbi:MAG: Nif3-like dinuclear metal center hexameric protein [Bacilli bacterium]|jgi:dinuclear metal center YbgI/SA1388 family protein|nr:Nif3-like dinuclear metal center hexameric protein [Bacilli bacterium]
MIEGKKLIREIYKRYPKKLSESWDHPGKQVGVLPEVIKKVLLCLDFDQTIYQKAKELQPDLIITHHPFIFGTVFKVLKNDEVRKETYFKVQDEMKSCIYSFHTCFDTAKGGMNDLLSNKLGLENTYIPKTNKTMRVGYLPQEITRNDFIPYALNRLNAPYGLLVKGKKEKIRKVALIGGGGASFYKDAILEEADIYISGDMSHHVRREITERDFNYLDVPHEIERIFLSGMEKTLLQIDPSLVIYVLDHEKEAEVYLKD